MSDQPTPREETDAPTAPDDPEADGAASPDETLGDDVPKTG
jgi:hypothetical protein